MPEALTFRAARSDTQSGIQRMLRRTADWTPAVLVTAVWAALFVSDLVLVRDYGCNLPYWEDWDLVPRLTVEKVDLPWLFSQNWEHRVPLPRLILVVLLRATKLDFRSGPYFNVSALAALALAMIVAARYVRGRSSYADVVFPLLLLNWGHWNNMLWNWQAQFICSTVLEGAVLLLIACRGNGLTIGVVAAIGGCLILLPMCGANGLAIAPLPALWLGWAGAMWLRRHAGGGRAAGMVALVLAFLTLASVTGYWLTYQPPPYTPKKLGVMPAILTFIAFVGVGFGRADWSAVVVRELLLPAAALIVTRLCLRRPLGPKDCLVFVFCVVLARGLQFQCEYYHMLSVVARRTAWGLAGIAGLLLGIGILVRAFRGCPEERLRSAGLLSFFGAFAALAAGLAWGRAGAVSDVHDTPRYYTLCVVPPCALLLTLEIYGGLRLLRFARPLLAGVALLVALGNVPDSRSQSAGRLAAGEKLRRDLQAGLPASVIVERHAADRSMFLIKESEPYFYPRCLLLLRDAGHPEFQAVKDDPPGSATR